LRRAYDYWQNQPGCYLFSNNLGLVASTSEDVAAKQNPQSLNSNILKRATKCKTIATPYLDYSIQPNRADLWGRKSRGMMHSTPPNGKKSNSWTGFWSGQKKKMTEKDLPHRISRPQKLCHWAQDRTQIVW